MKAYPAGPGTPDFPTAQFDSLSKMLETLIGLILPLHQLLEAQEGLENSITERLEIIMEAFGLIAINLQSTAEALSQITDRETAISDLKSAMEGMEMQLRRQDQGIAAISQTLKGLTEWLGTPPHPVVAPRF